VIPDPLHPAIVHFPIVLAILAPFIYAALFWAIRSGRAPVRAWLVALSFQALIAVSGGLALETGQNEEERVERVVAERHIERHEEAAERFLLLAVLTLPLIAAGLVHKPIGEVARGLALAATLGVAVAVGLVGHSGGDLVYEHGAAAAYTKEKTGSPGKGTLASAAERRSHDDDDDGD